MAKVTALWDTAESQRFPSQRLVRVPVGRKGHKPGKPVHKPQMVHMAPTVLQWKVHDLSVMGIGFEWNKS